VSGRADLDFQQQVELDLRYIRERSFWLDVKLIVQTVPAVLSGKGAY
jgi:lipopolysaccharide/colanic/teichoic acid biosynthesis glycosyltransferase